MSEAIRRQGLRDRVHDRILELLLDGAIAPGERIKIDAIALRLDVSQTPVREALVQLERTGLVVREAHKGYRMAPPLGPEQLDQLFEARLMLEVEAARLAARHASDLVDELRAAEDRHRVAGERAVAEMADGTPTAATIRDYFAADAAFHAVVFAHSGNRYLVEMSEGLGAQLHRMRQSMRHGITDVREAIAEHGAVLEAFAAGGADAEAAMRTHIENVRRRSLLDERQP